jgi:hypothetical protein
VTREDPDDELGDLDADALNPWTKDPSPLANIPPLCMAAATVGLYLQGTGSETVGVAVIVGAGVVWGSTVLYVERCGDDGEPEQSDLSRWSK